MAHRPKISVLMPSYNHQNFIAEAIDSVLQQTLSDIELIIVDDGSSDESTSIICSYKDERVRFKLLPTNLGACEAMNVGLELCKADLIAVCNSDDCWDKNKLELQLNVIEATPDIGAVFSDVRWVDSAGELIPADLLPSYHTIFRQKNRSRHEWIKTIIENGNCLCHPSILVRKEIFEKVGTYDNRYRQLPDMDMWLRLLQFYDIFVLNEQLVSFRLHENNTSRPILSTNIRSINEHRLLLARLMETISPANFRSTFIPQAQSHDDIVSEKAKYLLEYTGNHAGMFNQLGAEWYLTIDPKVTKFPISAHDFHSLNSRNSPWLSQELLHNAQELLRITEARVDELTAEVSSEKFRAKELDDEIALVVKQREESYEAVSALTRANEELNATIANEAVFNVSTKKLISTVLRRLTRIALSSLRQ